MSRLGLGILGAAAIAKKNCRGIQRTREGPGGVEVVAVGSRSSEKAQAFINELDLQGARAYGSYEEVLADSRVHAVYIPLPTALHQEWVQKAAATGKHILLEKPIALTPQDAEQIVTTCAAAGVQLMDGTMWMHNARTPRMEAVLAERLSPHGMGPLKAVTSTFCFSGDAAFLANDIRCKKGLDGLGCLGDMGWYCVRAALWAYSFDQPLSVSAHTAPLFNNEGVLLHCGATIVWPDGRRANFQCAFDQALTQYLEVAGTQGTLRLDDFVVPYREAENSFLVTERHGFGEMDVDVQTQTKEVVTDVPVPQETALWETFAACVRSVQQGGKPEEHWPRISLMTQRVICAIEESALDGCKTVKIKW